MKQTMRGPFVMRIIPNFLLLLVCAAIDVDEEEQRYLSYYTCHYANMLPGDGEAWERARDEFVASTMLEANNATTPTPACVAWVCDPSLKVWQVCTVFHTPWSDLIEEHLLFYHYCQS